MSDRATEIYKEICEAANVVNSKVDGVYVFINVKEMMSRDSYRARPLGRFQINIRNLGRRDTIFRTKVKDGSYDMLGVLDTIKGVVRAEKHLQEQQAAVEANKDIAKTIRDKYKLRTSYVSCYTGSSGSFCAPSIAEGKINVQINFGAVDPAVAERIMAFAQSLEAQP